MINFYERLPQKYKQLKTPYPNYDKCKLDVPMRMLICGGSGEGKTNSLLNIIVLMQYYTRIFIYARKLDEPLYAEMIRVLEMLGKKWGRTIVTYSSNVKDIPKCSAFDSKERNLCIFDDLITEKNLGNVSELFIKGRKDNISCIFLTQRYMMTPLLIRENIFYLVLKKINGTKNIRRILSDNSLGTDVDALEKMYNYSIKDGMTHFFLIDLHTNDDNLKFRHDLTGFIKYD